MLQLTVQIQSYFNNNIFQIRALSRNSSTRAPVSSAKLVKIRHFPDISKQFFKSIFQQCKILTEPPAATSIQIANAHSFRVHINITIIR